MKISDIPYIICKSLIYTILIELVLSILFGVRNKKDILNIILVNIFTNLIVTSIPILINYLYGSLYRTVVLIILEILTILVEGFIYKRVLKYKKINRYLLSLILNIVSYLMGFIIYGGVYL